jgi:DNA-binding transcriptional ArsR family regulator
MPQTRIHGKFYPLQHEEFLKLNKRLTQSELAVHLWLKTNDPFGDRLVEASTKQIGDDLNVSRRTVQRALVKLRDENLIDLIITKFQYRVKSLPPENISEPETSESKVKETLRVATPGSPSDTSVAIGTRMSPSVQECRHQYENVAISTRMSPPQPETQSEQKLENPKTLKTYSDFKNSLSEEERENFFNFVKEKISNLERPINDLEAWLASKNAAKQNRWEIYYRSYQEERINETHKTTKHSENGAGSALEAKKLAIAKFRQKMRVDESVKKPVDEPKNLRSASVGEATCGQALCHPKRDLNSVPRQISLEEFNKLLDNPPEREERKSLAQQRREQIAEAKRQQEEWKRANKEAADERAKQQNLNLEEYQAEIQRQIEEFNRLHNIGNINENDEENLEDE